MKTYQNVIGRNVPVWQRTLKHALVVAVLLFALFWLTVDDSLLDNAIWALGGAALFFLVMRNAYGMWIGRIMKRVFDIPLEGRSLLHLMGISLVLTAVFAVVDFILGRFGVRLGASVGFYVYLFGFWMICYLFGYLFPGRRS